MAINWDLAYSSAKKLDEEKEKEIEKRKKEELKTTEKNKSSGSRANPSFSNDKEKRDYIEKQKRNTTRAGIAGESNTVDASISDRAAARKAAPMKNIQQKITQPGNNSQLPGAVRNTQNDVSLAEIAEAKEKTEQFVELNKKVINDEYGVSDDKENNESVDNLSIISSASKPTSQKRVVNMKEDEEKSAIISKTKGMTDDERKAFLTEEARKRSRTTSNADIVMTQLKKQDAKAWEQEKADYNFQKENGLLKENDAKTQGYIDKFYSMSEEERQLVASIYADIENGTGKKVSYASTIAKEDKLKNQYGYTDEEIKAMRYFYGRYINKKNAKTDDINARLAMEKHPVLESMASIPMGIAGGVGAAVGIADSYIDNKRAEKIGIKDQGIDYNHSFSKMQRQAQSGRDEFTKTHDLMIGGYDVGDMLYNTVMSGAESATAAMLPGGAALLAVNAGTSKVNELSQRGLSTEDSIKGGVAAAATEFIFEKISIGNFKKMQEVEPDTIMDVVANVAKSMGVNASEEALTETANILYDTFAYGDMSEYQMQINYLVNSGEMTPDEAKKTVIKGLIGQVAEAAASGAIMGAGFGGVASVPNYISRSAAISQMGAQARKSEMKGQIIAEAQAAPKGSKPNKIVNSTIFNDKSATDKYVSDYKLGLMALESGKQYQKAGRFSDVKSEAELNERYNSALQMSNKAVAKHDTIETKKDRKIDKEYNVAKKNLAMYEAVEAAKNNPVAKTQSKIDELAKTELTNPRIKTDKGTLTVDGKNFNGKEFSEFKGVFKDKDGDNAVKTTDGQEFKVSDIVKIIKDKDVAEVYKATEGMSPEAANLFIANYDGDDVSDYKQAYNYYYKLGRAGLTAAEINKDDTVFGNYFTEEAQKAIATAGLKDREFKAGVTELTFSRTTKHQKQTMQLIDQWAKESGLEVIILKNSDKINGYHLQGTNRIVLYTEVGGKENLVTRTFGHEAFHFIADNSSAEADKLRSYVIEALEKNGVDIEKALEKYAGIVDGDGKNVYETRESQIDELVADSMFDVFTNEAAIEKLAKNDRTLAQKIADKFKEILDVIKSKLKMFGIENNNPEIAALMQDAESMEKIVNKFHDALVVAKDNYNVHESGKDAGNGQKNNAVETAKNIFYSIEDDEYSSIKNQIEKSKENLLSMSPVDAISYTSLVQDKKGFTEWVMNQLKSYGEKVSRQGYGDIIIDKKRIENGWRYIKNDFEKAAFLALPRVLKRGIEIGSHKKHKERPYNTKTFAAPISINGQIGIMAVVVREQGKFYYKVHRVLIDNNIKRNSSERAGAAFENAGSSPTASVSNNSISDKMNVVKKNFSISASTEEKGELVAVHNIYVDKMMDAFKLGGFPMPSIAVIKAKQGHDKYGPVSVVFNKNTIDPKADDRNKVYAADAYSPTFPNVKLTANKEKARALAEILNTSIAGVENNIIDKTENEIIRKAGTHHQLQRKFIEDNGIKIDGMKEPKLTNAYHKRMKAFVVENDITWDKLVNNAELRDEYIQKVAESSPSFRRENTISQIKAIFDDEFLINNDDIRDSFDKDFEILKDRVQPSFDESTYLYNIRDYLADYNNPSGYKSEYVEFIKGYTDGLVDKTEIYTGEDRFFENGEENPNAFKDYTAENVVDVMKAQAHQPGGGIGYLRALLGQKFSSIDDIRNNKGKIVSEDSFNEAADRLNDKFTSIASMGASFNNGMGLWNVTHDTFVQAIENGATKKAMIDALNDNGFRYVKPYFVDACMSFIEELKTVPTEYFEAKPERAVGFDEIEFVVVPANAPAQLIEQFNENGIAYKTYEAGNEKDRIAALNSRPDVLFSMKEDSPVDAYFGEVIKDNKHLKAVVSLLTDEKFSSSRKDIHLNGTDIHRIAKDLIKKTSSKYDLATFENQLTAVFDYMAASKNHIDAEEVTQILYGLSYKLLEQSEMRDTELYDQNSEVRKFLREQPIYISEKVKKEIASQFGDYKTFRNILMGKVMHMSTTNTEACSLDEVWQELSEMCPEYFPKDTNELDMPMQLAAFFDAVAPKTVNPYEHYEMNVEEAAAVFANEIFESYYKIRVEKTDSGKAKDILNEGIRKLSESKKAMIADFDRQKLENKEEYNKRISEYKIQRADADRRRRNRNEIERNYNYLNRRLIRETDNDHILEKFKPLVSSFRSIVPDGNSRFSRKALTEFENEYRKLEEKSTFFNEDFVTLISDFKDKVTGIDAPRMRDLDGYELEVLRNITEHVKYIVQNENRLFSEGLKGRVEDFGKNVHSELEGKKESKAQGVPERGARAKDIVRNGVDSFIKGLTKPEYLFDNLGSETLKTLYNELRNGENTEARIIYDAKLAEQEIKKRNNYDSRWSTQNVTVDLRSGKRTMTVEDLMALYATSKRKQGLEHMLNGGVILYTQKELIKKNGKSSENIKRDKIIFTEQDILTLEKSLTKDQKNYVNEMVEYITKTIGEKRNEVSMKLYGIEKYKEGFYFPIKVDRNFIDTSVGRQEVVSTIKNQSSSKRTVDHAKNPIEVIGFTDTVNNHIYDSALYCAYVLPINDFKRVYNFRDKVFEGDGAASLLSREISVKDDIRRTNGVNAIKEIEQFMIALDSGSRYENLMPLSAKLMARAKKTSVMANLSVVIQQPTAVFRAMLYIDPKHFATWAKKADIEEMKRWNGCALKKDIGYFDVNMGRTATDYMNEYDTDKSIKKDWSLKDKLKNSNVMLKVDQAAGWGATKADEMTWGAIWKACKKQVKAENPELSGDSLNAAAAELFQKTISKTQVYDSVFTKPEYTRRKEGFAMMATQFMSEPLTSLNMLAESVVKAKNTEKGSQQRKDARKFTGGAFACYMTSVVVNSALKSLVYTIRDDDEENTFLEKYIANVTEGIVTDPIGMIPYLKDILSIAQGYDLNRADVAVFTTMADAIKDLGSDKKTTYEKIMSVLKAAGQASGIPAYNVVRDAKALIDIAGKIADGVQNGFPETTGRGVLNEIKEVFDYVPGIDAENNYEQLYTSIVKGDKKHYDRVYNSLTADDKSKSSIENGIGKVLAEKNPALAETFNLILAGNSVEASEKIQELKNTGFSNEIINNALSTYKTNLKNELIDNEEESENNRIKQAAFARYDMNYSLYESLVDELIADGYNETIVREAIDSEKVELERAASEFSLNQKDEYTSYYDMRNALQKKNYDNFDTVFNKISDSSGEDEAVKNAKSEIKKAYKEGYLNDEKAGELLKKYVDEDYTDTDIAKELYKAKSKRDSIYDKVYDAIDNGGSFNIDYLRDFDVDKSDVEEQITSQYKSKLLEMEIGSEEYNELYERLIDAYVTIGKTEGYSKAKIRKWHNDAAKGERKKKMLK